MALCFISMLVSSGNSTAQNRKKIEILHCDSLVYNNKIVANAQRLLGNVNIRVDGAVMWCDSLYSYSNNMVDAFGKVHIVRGDTLDMYADYLNYNGNTKLAKARRNVKLIDKKTTLTTDSLDYSMVTDMGAYNYSGTVKDSTNVLNSVIGQYYVNQKKAYFKTKVEGTTKDYKIKSDTLIYFTDTKKVYIEGPTHIYNENDTLYAEYGWYDSLKNYARLIKRPKIWNVKQEVKADSIYYDKNSGEGIAMGHARVHDIENKFIVLGNSVKYNDISKIALATDSAVLIQYSESDSLYLHADCLKAFPDTLPKKAPAQQKKTDAKPVKKPKTTELSQAQSNSQENSLLPFNQPDGSPIAPIGATVALEPAPVVRDSLRADSIAHKPSAPDNRLVLAYNKVRFFRNDLQGKCDSLVYWSKDSTIQMFVKPVVWSGKNQISANFIEMLNRANNRDEILMKEDAFIIAMEDDSIRFNQIKGKSMIGFIRENSLEKINVNGNGESNYYARDKDGIVGLNKAKSSNICIYMSEGKVKKISFIKSPDGELKPMADLSDGDKFLPGFEWQAEIRPKNKDDIFRQPEEIKPVTQSKKKENKINILP